MELLRPSKQIEHGKMAAMDCMDCNFQGTTTNYPHKDQHQPSIDSLLHRLRQLVPHNAISESQQEGDHCCWEVNVIRDTAAYIHYLYSEITGSTIHSPSTTGLSDSTSSCSTEQLIQRKFRSKTLPRSG